MKEKILSIIGSCPYIQGRQKIKIMSWLALNVEEEDKEHCKKSCSVVEDDGGFVTRKEFKFEINRIWNVINDATAVVYG